MSQKIFRLALVALFEGRATPLQKTLIAEYLQDSENQELYFIWLEEWERENPQLIADADSAYLRLSKEVSRREHTITPLNAFRRPSFFFWQVVASVVLLLGLTAYFFRDLMLNQKYETAYGELKSVELSDGSKVTLNANSSLSVPRFGFGNNTREVFLTGEAEFSVKHLPTHHRFIVRTPDQLEVQVLGTEFMVYSRARGSKVVLNKGSVQLRSLKKREVKPMIILPGDVVVINNQGGLTLNHHQPVGTYTGWKDHRFTFKNTSVSEIADELNDVFGVQIIIADSALAKRTIGGTFKAETAEKLLKIMADILEVRIVPNPSPTDTPQNYTLTY